MQLPFLLLFALLAVGQNISFINPGLPGPNSQYANNPSFAYGSTIDIQWTPTSDSISLVLYQQTQGAQFEYIFRNRVGLSSYSWTVKTTKDLDISRIFFLEIFITGETGPSADSHYFNITGDAKSVASSSPSSSSVSASSSTNSTTSLTTPAGTTSAGTHSAETTSAATTPESSATQTPSPGGLSTGSKVGLGVGIPFGVIALALFGWFTLSLWKKANNNAHAQTPYQQPMMQNHYQQDKAYTPQGSFVKERAELHAPHVEMVPAEMPSNHHK